jgi:hypothetical protein
MADKEILTKKDGIIEQELDNEMILSNPDSGDIHILNETAKLVWVLIDGKHNMDAIEQIIKERFLTNNINNVKEDLERILSELKNKGLLD